MRYVSDSLVDKIKTHPLYSITLFAYFTVVRKCTKLLYSRTGQGWYYGTYTLHGGYLRLQTHTVTICNTYCFSTATMVAQTHLSDTLYVHCLSSQS